MAKDESIVSTSSNLAYGVVAHDPQERGQEHEYEVAALNQPQPQHSPAAVPSEKQTRAGTQEPTYELIAGN